MLNICLGISSYYIWQASEPAECFTPKPKVTAAYMIWPNWSNLSCYIFGMLPTVSFAILFCFLLFSSLTSLPQALPCLLELSKFYTFPFFASGYLIYLCYSMEQCPHPPAYLGQTPHMNLVSICSIFAALNESSEKRAITMARLCSRKVYQCL